MRDFMKWLFYAGLPLWVMLLGGVFFIVGGINDHNASSIFSAIGQANNAWVWSGAILTIFGLVIFLVRLVRGFLKK